MGAQQNRRQSQRIQPFVAPCRYVVADERVPGLLTDISRNGGRVHTEVEPPAVGAALSVIFNKNLVHSALSLLLNFCTLAVFYVMLNAQFLGIVQVLVYAGAIVVLFLFVVMLLGAELGEKVVTWLTLRNIIFIGLSLVLLTFVGTAVFENFIGGAKGDFTPEAAQQFGQVQLVGSVLFTDYVLSFQLVGVLLSVGVLGVIWLAKTLYPDQVDLDCATETSYFYRTFYKYELPEAELTALCGS